MGKGSRLIKGCGDPKGERAMITTVSATKLRNVNKRTTYREIHNRLKAIDHSKAIQLVEAIEDYSTREEAKALLRACWVS